jgi:hypothetical protein
MTTMTKRMAPFCGTVALLAQVFVFQGCGSSNNNGITGTGGTPGTGGTTTATGGTPGTGGTTTAGTGGTTTSTGGTPGTAGASGFGQPACGNTAAGTAIAKGITCTATDTALCYKTCGPEKTGVKSETCPAGGGTYAEMTGCSFDPTRDFTCYKVPAAADPSCPATAPMASSPCSIADCVVCGGPSAASAAGTGYLDSTGAAKAGYCVCQAGATSPSWSCASSTAWPCPTGIGCS